MEIDYIQTFFKDTDDLRQIIFFGAPGTGKSHLIREYTKDHEVMRTTFHPDSDYSTFVGCFKPASDNGRIVYKYVPQVFLKAYIKAWKMYFEAECTDVNYKQTESKSRALCYDTNKDENNGKYNNQRKLNDILYLVIEELNRGNCAQIFGDIFQLLDRNEEGFSEYSIDTDTDMQQLLQDEFKDVRFGDRDRKIGDTTISKIIDGEKLALPDNLYIWATMNTSDQSLFPIDSAFKRRWNWKYLPIVKGEKKLTIKLGGSNYDWWTFLQKINDMIADATMSEDKKIGYYFCTAKDGIINEDVFVNKVLFYLWNDVFKGEESSIFQNTDGQKIYFNMLFNSSYDDYSINTDVANSIMLNLIDTESNNEDHIKENDNSGKKKYSFNINGRIISNCNAVPYTTIEEYVKMNNHKTAAEVYRFWEPFKKYSQCSWLLDDDYNHDLRLKGSKGDRIAAEYTYEIKCAYNQSVWVNKDGWMHDKNNPNSKDTVAEFIDAVKKADIGIEITEIARQ